MQAFKRNILQHMLAVGYWMQTRQASGGMDPATATLELSRAGRTLRLTPQFVVEGAGGPITYVPRLQSGVSGFVGWLPYYNRQWPHATHKLAFKEHLQRAGLPTPAWGVGSTQPGVAYLVKAQQSTFGRGMRGPLPASQPVALAESEYWEAFVPGALVKAWYWGGALQVAEVIDPPRVQGDGLQTVAQLASQRLGPAAVAHMSLDLLALQGLTPGSVPPAKGVVGLDYRYLSPLSPAMVADHNVRAKIVGTPLEGQLQQAGQVALEGVPADQRAATAFTLDGVLDAAGRVWWLEVNCNPQMHPAFYEGMLDSLLPGEGG